MWRSFLCVSAVCGLALDSNTIRSSKEQPSPELPRGGCSNRAQRRPSSQDRHVERQQDRATDRETDRETDRLFTDGFNRTKAPEMSSCVRSGDCAAGLCCVRYLTGKRCQRIPGEGEACLLRGSTKLRRKLGRSGRRQGEPTARGCVHSARERARGKQGILGRKRRTAERSC
ncbi:hypothetical protein KUCAC02_028434 [Chaenocephalus aceratus]|uniref:Uncharacterized protein n=1 Tax=Chaenocephalus aceratus TaxID=36190 RepID=A0ACB9X3F3_CHAAC|nr:hypothetical protein KUCAC02_028434 [Chaenocephalus aceratus]